MALDRNESSTATHAARFACLLVWRLICNGAAVATPPCAFPPPAAAPSLFFFMIKKMPPPTSPQMQQSASKPPTVSGARDTRCKLSRVALWRCEGGEVRGGV